MKFINILDKDCNLYLGTELSACVDLRARETVILEPFKVTTIPLGVKISKEYVESLVDSNEWFLAMFIRSSLAAKGVILVNSVGVIDLDYYDEMKAMLMNLTNEPIEISVGERIVQTTLLHTATTKAFGVTTSTKRTGGVGSTNAIEEPDKL
jgi:dUTP pyrophosphatase